MIHAYLLFLSGMAAVPIVLHMLKRGKPRQITFPAIRFLLERQTQSKRRMNLQNILLLLLRILLIVIACLALSRIQIANPGIDLGQEQASTSPWLLTSVPVWECAKAAQAL